jgi:hypothetical protein
MRGVADFRDPPPADQVAHRERASREEAVSFQLGQLASLRSLVASNTASRRRDHVLTTLCPCIRSNMCHARGKAPDGTDGN